MTHKSRGFTMLEALIGIFLLAILSLGIYTSYAFSMKMSVHNRLRTEAAAIAEKKIEAIRAMKYAEIGTSGGIPPGNLIADETEESNGANFSIHTSVRYIDDAYDEKAPLDTAPADYKQVEIRVNWPTNMEDKNIILNTFVAPPRIETNLGAGVLIINAVDGNGTPLVGTNVHIKNSTVAPPIDVTEDTDENGSLLLPGVPKSGNNYELTLSKNNYETVITYLPYPDSPYLPIDPHISVNEGEVTSKVFVIDLFGHLNLHFIDTLGADLPDFLFSLNGGRTIGTTVESAPQSVYFYNETALASGSDGHWNSPDLGKGPYAFSFTSATYEAITASAIQPWIVSPGGTNEITIVMGKKTDNILVVTVKEQGGETPIPGASVKITDSLGVVFQETTTDNSGIAYFPQVENPAKVLNPAETYTLDVAKDTYTPVQTTTTVSELTRKNVVLLKQ